MNIINNNNKNRNIIKIKQNKTKQNSFETIDKLFPIKNNKSYQNISRNQNFLTVKYSNNDIINNREHKVNIIRLTKRKSNNANQKKKLIQLKNKFTIKNININNTISIRNKSPKNEINIMKLNLKNNINGTLKRLSPNPDYIIFKLLNISKGKIKKTSSNKTQSNSFQKRIKNLKINKKPMNYYTKQSELKKDKQTNPLKKIKFKYKEN